MFLTVARLESTIKNAVRVRLAGVHPHRNEQPSGHRGSPERHCDLPSGKFAGTPQVKIDPVSRQSGRCVCPPRAPSSEPLVRAPV